MLLHYINRVIVPFVRTSSLFIVNSKLFLINPHLSQARALCAKRKFAARNNTEFNWHELKRRLKDTLSHATNVLVGANKLYTNGRRRKLTKTLDQMWSSLVIIETDWIKVSNVCWQGVSCVKSLWHDQVSNCVVSLYRLALKLKGVAQIHKKFKAIPGHRPLVGTSPVAAAKHVGHSVQPWTLYNHSTCSARRCSKRLD